MIRAAVAIVLLVGCSPHAAAEPADGGTIDAGTCPTPVDDAIGAPTLESAPAALCPVSARGAMQWPPCNGSIVVAVGEGTDCAYYFLYDATSHALRATAHGCNQRVSCTSRAPGFVFPDACFASPSNATALCAKDAGSD